MVNDAFCPNISQDLTGISGVDANGNAVNLQDGKYKILDVVNCAVGTDDDMTIEQKFSPAKQRIAIG